MNNDKLFISQQHNLASLLESLELKNLKPAETLMEAKIQFAAKEKLNDKDQRRLRRFRQMVGSLQYPTATRPDILYMVNRMLQYMVNPTHIH